MAINSGSLTRDARDTRKRWFHPLMRAIPVNMRPKVDEAVGIAVARFQQGNVITVPAEVVLATAEC